MLTEPLNQLNDNSELCEFCKFVVSELAAHDEI